MTTLRTEFYAFEFVVPTFLSTFTEDMADIILASAKYSYDVNKRLVPIWTGESRGGFRELAKLLGIPPNTTSVIEDRVRRNRHGNIKTPTSAASSAKGPYYDGDGKLVFEFFNDADGYRFNDLPGGKKGPWDFGPSFWRTFKRSAERGINHYRFDLKKYTTKVRIFRS